MSGPRYKSGVECWALNLRNNGGSTVTENNFLGSFQHSNTADRVYSLPDVTGNILVSSAIQTIDGLKTIAASTGIAFNDGAPNVTTNKLYNVGGSLYFNGSIIGSGGSGNGGGSVDVIDGYSTTIGNDSDTSFTITHPLATTDIDVIAWELTGLKRKIPGLETRIVDANNITVIFTSAPAANSVRILIQKSGVSSLLTTLGDFAYGGVDGAITRLPGPTINGIYFLSETVTNSQPVAPAWLESTGTGKIVLNQNPEFTEGIILDSSTPTVTTNKLYQNNGDLYFNGSKVGAGGGSSNGSSLSFEITQTAHGLSILTPIYFDIDTSTWKAAQANSQDTLATHVIVKITDVNTFTAGQAGIFTITNHGLGLGYWFTDEGAAGTLTQNNLSYSNPILFVTDANTVILLNYRPSSSNWDSFMFPNEIAITAAITLDESNIGKLHVCSGTSADYAVILPTPVGHRGELIAFDMDAALTKIVTLDAGVGLTINGERYRKMWAKENCVLRSSGSEWKKIAGVTIPMSGCLRIGANQTFSSGTVTVLTCFTSSYSLNAPAAFQTAASSLFTILRPGEYNINVEVSTSISNTSASDTQIMIAKNGSNIRVGETGRGASQSAFLHASCEPNLLAGNVISLKSYYYGGSFSTSIFIPASDNVYSEFRVTEIPTW